MSADKDNTTKADNKNAKEKTVRAKRSTTLFTKGRKLPMIHQLKDGQFALLRHDKAIDSLIAEIIPSNRAREFIDRSHPPVVVPIDGRDDIVLLYLWDPSRNSYDSGQEVSVDDPRVPRRSLRNK